MISSPNDIAFIIGGITKEELLRLSLQRDNYYYQKCWNKCDKLGNTKYDKSGMPEQRCINPSVKFLK